MSKIGWCTSTLNPISGCLNFNTVHCGDFCYARKMAFRLKGRYGYPEDEPFRPTFHPEVLQKIKNLKGSGKRIFLDSMSDWFGPGVEPDWIKQSIEAVASKPEHTFLVLTKRPDNIPHQYFPKNLWLGVSVTKQDDAWRIDALYNKTCLSQKKFISFEPLHGPITYDLAGISWVIIGAESGNRTGKVITENEWAYRLVEDARNLEIPVFVKDNLAKAKIHSKEFPREMIKKEDALAETRA
jgi:protein gp37